MTAASRGHGLFEPALWRRAELMALVFETGTPGPPTLGLVFRDVDAAGAVFLGWRHRLGAVDEHEVIRVAIIEGELPSRPPGYSIHLGRDRDGATSHGDVWRRMPRADLPHLRRFKEALARHGRYALAPAAYCRRITILTEHAIGKRQLALRRASDVARTGDPDAALWSA